MWVDGLVSGWVWDFLQKAKRPIYLSDFLPAGREYVMCILAEGPHLYSGQRPEFMWGPSASIHIASGQRSLTLCGPDLIRSWPYAGPTSRVRKPCRRVVLTDKIAMHPTTTQPPPPFWILTLWWFYSQPKQSSLIGVVIWERERGKKLLPSPTTLLIHHQVLIHNLPTSSLKSIR